MITRGFGPVSCVFIGDSPCFMRMSALSGGFAYAQYLKENAVPPKLDEACMAINKDRCWWRVGGRRIGKRLQHVQDSSFREGSRI